MARTKQTARRHQSYTVSHAQLPEVAREAARKTQQKQRTVSRSNRRGGRGAGGAGAGGAGAEGAEGGERPVDREVRFLQDTTHLLIPRAPFLRVVREIAQEITPTIRFEASAIEDLRHASEAYLISVFQDCNEIAGHAGRKGVTERDMRLARRIRGDTLQMGK